MARIVDSQDFSDHIHEVGLEAGVGLVPVTNFNYDIFDVPSENPDSISIDQATSAFSEILSWILASDSFEHAGAKAAALSVLLDPTGKFRSLGAVARVAGCSRALLSKALLELRDRFKLGQNFRGTLIRQNCAGAQRRLVEAGNHA
jgi:hypothetical protein